MRTGRRRKEKLVSAYWHWAITSRQTISRNERWNVDRTPGEAPGVDGRRRRVFVVGSAGPFGLCPIESCRDTNRRFQKVVGPFDPTIVFRQLYSRQSMSLHAALMPSAKVHFKKLQLVLSQSNARAGMSRVVSPCGIAAHGCSQIRFQERISCGQLAVVLFSNQLAGKPCSAILQFCIYRSRGIAV